MVIEAVRGQRTAVVKESVDLIYNLALLWSELGIAASEIWAEMDRRQALLGTAEKLPKDSEESLTSRDRGRPPSGGTESLWTLRWRGLDSNHRSRNCRRFRKSFNLRLVVKDPEKGLPAQGTEVQIFSRRSRGWVTTDPRLAAGVE